MNQNKVVLMVPQVKEQIYMPKLATLFDFKLCVLSTLSTHKKKVKKMNKPFFI